MYNLTYCYLHTGLENEMPLAQMKSMSYRERIIIIHIEMHDSMCVLQPQTRIWIWTCSVPLRIPARLMDCQCYIRTDGPAGQQGTSHFFLCSMRLTLVIDNTRAPNRFIRKCVPFIPLQKLSFCPLDGRMSDGPASNELIQSTFSWLLPLTTFSAARAFVMDWLTGILT